jgi:hypothetical protein
MPCNSNFSLFTPLKIPNIRFPYPYVYLEYDNKILLFINL